MRHLPFLKAREIDFASTLQKKNAQTSLKQIIRELEATQQTVYSPMILNGSGFGLLANTRISKEELQILQRKIVLSHAAGTGEYLSDNVIRLMLVLKINSLARGFSGIRLSVIEALISLVNNEVYPCVPAKGSVGASGDLAPLAHLVLPLLGENLRL